MSRIDPIKKSFEPKNFPKKRKEKIDDILASIRNFIVRTKKSLMTKKISVAPKEANRISKFFQKKDF